MKLSELVRIDSRFEKAVNLLLDIDNSKKIGNYIPTHSSMVILRDFMTSIQMPDAERASLFIGPYGKGKSHLLLILLNLISGKDSDEIGTLIRRIKKTDPAAYALVRDVRKRFSPFLPVVITPGNGTLAQAFIRSLGASLLRAGLEDVVPDDYFSSAVHTVEMWKEQYPETYKGFKELIEGNDADSFVSALRNYDTKAISEFRRVYPRLTSGSIFNPVIEEDAVAVYRSVNRKLSEQYGYKGIYIVFDEFSKFLEGSDPERFSADMASLQGICELANSSREEQLHIVCVVHRSIKTYKDLPESVMNAFRGVEGRLTEKRFIVSSQNNFELIADAVTKTTAYKKWKQDAEERAELENDSYALRSFRSLFDRGDYDRIIGDGCYPLTPVAAMLLLHLSELIAQNERTLFTYIAGKEIGGLYHTVKKADDDASIGVGSIYDYFSTMMRDSFLPSVHHEWVKAEHALSCTEDACEQEIIKGLAVIRMINRHSEIPAADEMLRLAAGFSAEEYETAKNSLIDAGVIKLRQRTGEYEFKNNIGIDVETLISDCIQKNFMRADVGSALRTAIKEKYTVPKKHDQTYRITRYFNHCFMTAEQFLALGDPSYLEWKNSPDGVIINILPRQGLDCDAAAGHAAEIGSGTLIVRIPKESSFDYEYAVKRFLAIRKIIAESGFDDDRQIIRRELEDLLEDTAGSINDFYREAYMSSGTVIMYDGIHTVDDRGFNRLVSDICDRAYSRTPKINHELINRHVVTGQIARARSTILKGMLSGADLSAYEKGTSAESTIYRAVMLHTKNDANLSAARGEIKDFIRTSVGAKMSFSTIVNRLTSAPYGMRKGILPFYLLEEILLLEDMPVISINDKEVTLSDSAIVSAVARPAEYYLYVEEETAQKSAYISELEKLFDDYKLYCADIDRKNKLTHLSCLMQAWYRSLPQSSLVFRKEDYDGQDIEQIAAFRNELSAAYINPREFLFDRIPKIFAGTELSHVPARIREIRSDLDAHIHRLKAETVRVIRERFSIPGDQDLRQSLCSWYDALPEQAKRGVFNTEAEALLRYLKGLDTGDEEEIAGKIVNIITGGYIEDWKDGMVDGFDGQLLLVVQEILKAGSNTSQETVIRNAGGDSDVLFYDFDMENISSTGRFFKNTLGDMLEEYDGILDNREKIGILVDAIRQLSGKGDGV